MKIRGVLGLLLWLPALAFAQQPYYGTRAASVRVSEGADPSDLDRIPLRTGDIISPENVRAGIQALFDTGRYRTVDVDAASSATGTDLTFNVSRHYFFGTFTLKPENLLGRPLSTLVRLPVGQKYSEGQVQEIREEAQRMLKEAGYFDVPLTVQSRIDSERRLQSIELFADTDIKRRARVSAVEINGGGGTFTPARLRDAFSVSPGDRYSASDVDKGVAEIKRRFLEKNFLNTSVEVAPEYTASSNTVRLVVTIQPGQETVIDTGKQIPDDDIRNLVPIFEEGSFDPDLIREGRARIVEYLQQKGYFEAVVEGPEIVPASFGNPTRIIFSIKPGEEHRVKSVQFQGNDVFTDVEIQKRIRVHPAALFNRGLYSDSLAQTDVATIQNMYRRAGFEAAFVEVHQGEINDKHEIDVVFDITENSRYPVERLVFIGNMALTEAKLREASGIKEGDFFSPEAADLARTALTRTYYREGYPDVLITATADRNPDTNGRVLTYRITENQKHTVGEILVSGNTRTNPKFIRTTSGIKEYTPYNPEVVLEGQRKLYATGLFTHVDVVPLEQDTGEVRTLLVQVEEAKPILVTPGIGVKEYAGPRLTLDVSHNNLWGVNRALAVRIRAGLYEQQFQTTYHEPRLFNHEKLDGFGTLTIENRNRPSYKTSGTEFALQIRKQLTNTRSVIGTASYQDVDLKDIKYNQVTRKFPDVEGIIQIARVGASFLSDNRDDALDPKNGVFTTSTAQIASTAIGSEVNFLALFNQSTFQRTNRRGTLAISSRIGWKVPYGGTPELPITERYFAGGSTTLRGFGVDEAGPPGGGQLLTIGNVEYRMPPSACKKKTLGSAIFYDTGNVYERPSDFSLADFTHSAGLGLRFLTPLGPVRFDAGINLRPKTIGTNDVGLPIREDRVHYFFTLGHPF